jgi:hypothetical protein
MIKKKQSVNRNNSYRYSTHAGTAETSTIKGLMNLPNLNANSAFGSHA